jgi:hypothetical protein
VSIIASLSPCVVGLYKCSRFNIDITDLCLPLRLGHIHIYHTGL